MKDLYSISGESAEYQANPSTFLFLATASTVLSSVNEVLCFRVENSLPFLADTPYDGTFGEKAIDHVARL